MKQNLRTQSCMSCPVCMVAACTRVYTEVALLPSFMTCDSSHQCGHWRSWACEVWLPLWVAMQIMASTDETFCPYRHSIGRSTSGLRPCYCYQGGRRFVSSHWVACEYIVSELTNSTANSSIWGSLRLSPMSTLHLRLLHSLVPCWEKVNNSQERYTLAVK